MITTWKCDVCRDERPDANIGVFRHDASAIFGVAAGSVVFNVKYCKDRPWCSAAAPLGIPVLEQPRVKVAPPAAIKIEEPQTPGGQKANEQNSKVFPTRRGRRCDHTAGGSDLCVAGRWPMKHKWTWQEIVLAVLFAVFLFLFIVLGSWGFLD